MGRRPIGKQALTDAERQRRYRARLRYPRAQGLALTVLLLKVAQKRMAQLEAEAEALKAQLAGAKKRIAEQTRRRRKLRTSKSAKK